LRSTAKYSAATTVSHGVGHASVRGANWQGKRAGNERRWFGQTTSGSHVVSVIWSVIRCRAPTFRLGQRSHIPGEHRYAYCFSPLVIVLRFVEPRFRCASHPFPRRFWFDCGAGVGSIALAR
jgi:hypothetical protein